MGARRSRRRPWSARRGRCQPGSARSRRSSKGCEQSLSWGDANGPAGAAPSGTTGRLPAMTDALRRPVLYQRHSDIGAKFAAFGGWDMPLEYAGGGVLKEHAAVREAVGVFDVSHLGKATIRGAGAADFVNACLTNDLDRIAAGQAQYTMCGDDATGGVVDDMIVYRYADDHLFVIPNAANTAEVVRRLAAAAPAGITVTNEHHDHAVLAVQGPRSADVLDAIGLPTAHP